jgi:hypothetical protein
MGRGAGHETGRCGPGKEIYYVCVPAYIWVFPGLQRTRHGLTGLVQSALLLPAKVYTIELQYFSSHVTLWCVLRGVENEVSD